MLALIFSLFCEAQFFIEKFQLKKIQNLQPFQIWKGKNILLCVSGVGKINATIATIFLLAKMKNIRGVVNIGCCGKKDANIGDIFLCHKIMDSERRKSFYPTILFNTNLFFHEIISFDKEQKKLTKELCDMESFAIFSAAIKFLPIEMIHAIKVVSDNDKKNFKEITKKDVYTLMSRSFEKIAVFLQKFQDLIKEYKRGRKEKIQYLFFERKWSFTQTEICQLKDLLFSFVKKPDFSQIKDFSKKDLFTYLRKEKAKQKIFL